VKDIKICLFWHNLNSDNYGVSALAISHLNLLVELATKKNVVLQIDTWGTPASGLLKIQTDLENRLNLKIKHHSYSLRHVARQLVCLKFININPFKKHDYDYVFDIGEGDSFTDIYGLKRFIIFSINKYFALRAKIPIIIAPQTIGPFNHKFTSKIAGYLMRKSDAIYVRDHKSSDYLKSMGVKHVEASDVAFLLPYDLQKICENSVGINVSGLLWHGGYTQNNQFNLSVDYQVLVIAIIKGFVERGKKVFLVGHVISDTDEIEDDYRTMCNLKKQYFEDENLVELAPKFEGPIQAKSFISSLEFFTGSRMHATIAAISTGVATIPLAYSRKFSGVFGTINYPHTIDLYGDHNIAEIEKVFFNQFDNNQYLLQENAKASAEKAKKNLNVYLQYLQGILR
jgi:polysaccharide pyruvyl transferase WcaK-like protein